jgi:hypothetical protein
MDKLPGSYLYFFFLAAIFYSNGVWAQTSITDTAVYRGAVNNVIKLYADSLGENLRLYSGTEFTGGYRRSAGHPFFIFEEPQNGDVFYEGIHYPHVLLAYDLTRDELIFINHVKNLNVKLAKQKVDSFTIQDHAFVHLRHERDWVHQPIEGFYEVLYQATVMVLAKRKKTLRESAKAEEPARFLQSNAYYVRKGNVYYLIDNKRSLLNACSDRRADILKFMQKENLSFKNNPEQTIIRVIDHYTQLKK